MIFSSVEILFDLDSRKIQPEEVIMFRVFIVCVLTLLLSNVALADEPARPAPSVLVTTSVGYPMALKTGTALPPGIAHGLAVVAPIKNGWSHVGEIATTTSFSTWQPSLLLIIGSSKKLAPNFVLGASVFYKLTPPYDEATSPTHVLGGSIVPTIPISIGSLSFPTAIGVNLATGDLTFAFNLKLAIKVN